MHKIALAFIILLLLCTSYFAQPLTLTPSPIPTLSPQLTATNSVTPTVSVPAQFVAPLPIYTDPSGAPRDGRWSFDSQEFTFGVDGLYEKQDHRLDGWIVYNISDGTIHKTPNRPLQPVLSADEQQMFQSNEQLTYESPNGRWLVFGGQSINNLWSPLTIIDKLSGQRVVTHIDLVWSNESDNFPVWWNDNSTAFVIGKPSAAGDGKPDQYYYVSSYSNAVTQAVIQEIRLDIIGSQIPYGTYRFLDLSPTGEYTLILACEQTTTGGFDLFLWHISNPVLNRLLPNINTDYGRLLAGHFVANRPNEILLFNADGVVRYNLTTETSTIIRNDITSAQAFQAYFSPDGEWLATTDVNNGTVYVLKLDASPAAIMPTPTAGLSPQPTVTIGKTPAISVPSQLVAPLPIYTQQYSAPQEGQWSHDSQMFTFGVSGLYEDYDPEPDVWYSYQTTTRMIQESLTRPLMPNLTTAERENFQPNEMLTYESPNRRWLVFGGGSVNDLASPLTIVDTVSGQRLVTTLDLLEAYDSERFPIWWNDDSTAFVIGRPSSTNYGDGRPQYYYYISNFGNDLAETTLQEMQLTINNSPYSYSVVRFLDLSPTGDYGLFLADEYKGVAPTDYVLFLWHFSNPALNRVLPNVSTYYGTLLAGHFVTSNLNEVLLFNLDGILRYNLTTETSTIIRNDITSAQAFQAYFSPDGEWLATTGSGAGTVYVIGVDEFSVTITPTPSMNPLGTR